MSQVVGSSLGEGEFELRFNAFNRVVMTALLCGPRTCHVVLSGERLDVSMGIGGWVFSASVPRSSLGAAARVTGPVTGWGAHGWRGRWLINGSSSGLVRVSIDPPGRGRCTGFPVKLKALTLSLEQPDEFIAALADGANQPG
jgi:hypothetical protein